MNVYAVFAGDNQDKLKQSINKNFPDDHYQLTSGDWLVAVDKTTQQVANLILFGDEDAPAETPSTAGSVIVAKLDSNYWGYHNKDIWDWIDLKKKAGH